MKQQTLTFLLLTSDCLSSVLKITSHGLVDAKIHLQEAFSVKKIKCSWEAVGATPPTMKCLELGKVQHANESDPNFSLHFQSESANHNLCALLTTKGHEEAEDTMRFSLSVKALEDKPVTTPCG